MPWRGLNLSESVKIRELTLKRRRDLSSAKNRKKKENMDNGMLIGKSDSKLKVSTLNYFSFLLEPKLPKEYDKA